MAIRATAPRIPTKAIAPSVRCPAGHFSPYSDGEKDAFAKDFANIRRCRKGAKVAASPFSPFTGRRCRQADEVRRQDR
ncbi:MAG: hypothetical protein EOQ86_30895 [Mesorhizobium sp.]|nr:MAG: hypothetical protein EOQ85_32310 [Mesorhizobium sp.]RWH76304.1 MAG: hypothetical protein EOQ86_30895 [Mesorhizobium sp.]RWH83894.1 MAG: hypothetical protein EOQ87_32065 [Mesorhizobium sp.]RWH95215.1 MAG: hypothetical protein EOQ89_31800 [Mesorhizobium sp.]RWH96624.1 MAG: hypothetical protein EOQ88_19685 [Mesorhizobium sp.]